MRSYSSALVAALGACSAPFAIAGGGVLGAPVDMVCLAFMIAGIVVFTIGFESSTEKLEHKLEDQPAYYQMLFKTYKELMIMGIISFSLTISYELGIHYEHDIFICFEFAHILIFFVAILYIGNAICASLSMEKTRATWDRIANETLEECLAAMEVHVTRASSSSIRRMWSRLPTPSCGWREEADYKILRFMFLRDCYLPQNFDYTSYTRAKLMHIIKEVVEISVKTWSVILAICAIVVGGTFIVRAVVDDECVTVCAGQANDADRRMLGGYGEGQEVVTAGECICDLETVHRRLGGDGSGGGGAVGDGLGFLSNGAAHMSPLQAKANAIVLGSVAWCLFIGQIVLTFFVSFKKGDLIEDDIKRLLELEELPHRSSPEMGALLPKYLNKLNEEVVEQSTKLDAEALAQQKSIGISRKLAVACVRAKFNNATHNMAEHHVKKHAVSHETIERVEFFNQVLSLLNCFYMGFYLVHVRPNISITDWTGSEAIVVHLLLIFPCLGLVFWAAPSTAKELALVTGVMHEDKDLVAHVFHLMEEVIEIRDTLRAGLIDLVRMWDEEAGTETIDLTGEPTELAKLAAEATFNRMDLDDGGTIDYAEFRKGLDEFGIHLTKHNFKKLMRLIDPDQSGEMTMTEWLEFFTISEEAMIKQTTSVNNPTGINLMSHLENAVGAPLLVAEMVGGKTLDLVSGVNVKEIKQNSRERSPTPDSGDVVSYKNPLKDSETEAD